MFREGWRTQLKGAMREREVVAVVRGFMAEWSRQEIASLPPGAWPSRIASSADVISHSVVLAGLHARFEGAPARLKFVQEMLLFFTQAAVRVVRLREEAAAADCPAGERRKARGTAKRRRKGARGSAPVELRQRRREPAWR